MKQTKPKYPMASLFLENIWPNGQYGKDDNLDIEDKGEIMIGFQDEKLWFEDRELVSTSQTTCFWTFKSGRDPI